MTDDPTAEPERALSPQPRRESRCPECGAAATEDSLRDRKLSAMGYLHDDQMFECEACGHSYPHGVPVGEYDGDSDDLWCDVCDRGYLRVHRVRVTDHDPDGTPAGVVEVGVDLKCHHHHPFDCPDCGAAIPADGVVLTAAGGRLCPACDRHLARDAVPYCFYFRQTQRMTDTDGIALLGVPTITGELNPAQPYGFPAGDPPCGEPLCIEHGQGTVGCPDPDADADPDADSPPDDESIPD